MIINNARKCTEETKFYQLHDKMNNMNNMMILLFSCNVSFNIAPLNVDRCGASVDDDIM